VRSWAFDGLGLFGRESFLSANKDPEDSVSMQNTSFEYFMITIVLMFWVFLFLQNVREQPPLTGSDAPILVSTI
jgi:hypothetical protein